MQEVHLTTMGHYSLLFELYVRIFVATMLFPRNELAGKHSVLNVSAPTKLDAVTPPVKFNREAQDGYSK